MKPDKAKVERFAKGVAQGMTIRDAATAAGYSARSSRPYQLNGRPQFKERVAKLKEELEWGGSSDLGPVINMLMRCAKNAESSESPAGWSAAQRLLAEAARLKQLLSDGERQTEAYNWAKRFVAS